MTRRYEFVVDGVAGPRVLSELVGFSPTTEDGQTRIVGDVRDQAEIDGICARLRDAGYAVIAMGPA